MGKATLERHGRERLRRRFRPGQVRLLFIGESPPASGRFFYVGDSGLYRAMRSVFQLVDPAIGDEEFLEVFRASGCYLVDLCAEPVDKLDAKSRRDSCRAGEASLERALARLQPAGIATLLRSIEGNVARAAARAGWHGPSIHLPYPGRWSRHREAFAGALAPMIGGLVQSSLTGEPGQSRAAQPEGGPLIHGNRAQLFIEPDGRSVPIEHGPFHAAAVPFHRQAGQGGE